MRYTDKQLEAINTIDKNLHIIACAGSGKTQVISQRIINILKGNVQPSHIIAFTYTEKAASELQARILKLCREQLPDIQGVAEMYVGTIHAWCLNVLQEYKYEFRKFSVLDEIKLKLFVERNFNKIGMKDLGMERFVDTGHFIQLMGILRESEFVEPTSIPENLILALKKYEETLINHCYLDFTMIMTKAFEFLSTDSEFIEKVKRNIGYLIVDEYQDVNPIQEKIIRSIYDLGSNVCVVGDDDQTIFQWRGSHIDYIQKFSERYLNVKEIVLDDNFRSAKSVIDVAIKCIGNNKKRIDKEMEASGSQVYQRGDILYNQFDSVDEENDFIVKTIRNLRGVEFKDKDDSENRGLDFSDFTILIRKWKKAQAIIEKFKEENIPFIVTGVNNLFQRQEIRASKAIYDFLDNQIDKSVLFDYWLTLSPKIQETKLEEAIGFLNKIRPTKNSYYEGFILQDIFYKFLDIAGIREESFYNSENSSISGFNFHEIIFYNLGMFSQIINDFESIYFKTEPLQKLKTFINFLHYTAEDYYPEGWLNNTYKTPNAVQIMTIYQAKGLEFPVVFIPGLNKNYMPTNQPTGKQVWHFIDRNSIVDSERYFPHEEDERRLMYVGITRSKKFLFVSRAPDGRMQGKESVFGSEIRKSEYVFSSKERDFSERIKTIPKPSIELSNISLSFSLLKAFFDCPYSFKFFSFYGFQPPLGARMGYGSAIHNALMELHREYLEGKLYDKDQLSDLVDRHAHFPYATEKVIDDMTTRANESVEIYYDKNVVEFKEIEFAEKDIQIDLGDGIIVVGSMDLIKKKNVDGTIEKTIIDFKSTEDAQAYNASIDQLKLYALGYKELTGENADFLQIYNLDHNEGYKSELITKDLDDMRTKIIDAANDIRANNLNHSCNDPKCVCRFKKQLEV